MLNWKLKPTVWEYGPRWTIYLDDTKYAASNNCVSLLNLKTIQMTEDCSDCWTESVDDLLTQIKLFENREAINQMYA